MFQTNLAVLRTHYEALAQVLEAENPLSLPSIFVSESSLNGAPTLTVEGQLIHSARNPLREAKRLVEGELKAAGSSEGAIVLLGFGLGYAAEAVLELESGRRLIIVEKRPAILRKALETRDLRYVFTSGKTIVVLGGHDGGILAALEAVQKVHAVIRNQTLIKLDAAWYTAVDQHIELWRNKDAVNMATLRRFGKRWVRNLGANLEAIRDFPGVNSLFDQFNFPVLLLAAGPSLDELRPYLDACRERCLVIAVDTAARFLQTAKIPADFIVSVDPQFWNLRHLDPLRTGDGGTCLIAEAATQPAALRLCRRT
ncbi:MAG: DUF115 domain-containing protein, partial [Spirochaetaceae bacterium]|nr:DUF115 domain-containing protein [Spirochaetaceae bacterium]